MWPSAVSPAVSRTVAIWSLPIRLRSGAPSKVAARSTLVDSARFPDHHRLMAEQRRVIKSADAPGPGGYYSQAIASGDLLFCSGQIAIDAKTGQMVEGGIEAETEQVLTNLKAVLAAAGASLGRGQNDDLLVRFLRFSGHERRLCALLPH